MTIPILQNDKVALLPLEEQHLEQLQRIAQNKSLATFLRADKAKIYPHDRN
ncbi:hypothetical protein ACFQZI_06015 [Mucilaginibacter lutimaris]|uniref:Uncharacterized protein n=1 Tax=Mucilaginibacter lutimaris TaxID=931629 RepID=A0ABW2ZDY9_9SPHI